MSRSSLSLSAVLLLFLPAAAAAAPHGSGFPPPDVAPPPNITLPQAPFSNGNGNPNIPLAPSGKSGSGGASPVGRLVPHGGSLPGGGGPGAPGSSPGAGLVDQVGAGHWEIWWRLHRDGWLDLKRSVHATLPTDGSDGWFLGRGRRSAAEEGFAPTDVQRRDEILPALLGALENETAVDALTGALIAVAKVGDDVAGGPPLSPVLATFLAHGNQEVRETAAVALGILGEAQGLHLLEALLRDTPVGRALVGAHTGVDERTRAFAAYGLGLVGGRARPSAERRHLVTALLETLDADDGRRADVPAACIVALGMVPLAWDPPRGTAPTGRALQVARLEAYAERRDAPLLARAHVPTALARLIVASGVPAADARALEERFLARAGESLRAGGEPRELVQSTVLACGVLGAAGRRSTEVVTLLTSTESVVRDAVARDFTTIALAECVASATADRVLGWLTERLDEANARRRAWAGMSLGVALRRALDLGLASPAVRRAEERLRAAFAGARDPVRAGALALGLGLRRDVASVAALHERLSARGDDDARGHAAVALGLIGTPEAVSWILEALEGATYRPRLFESAAVALGLLGAKDTVPLLVERLERAPGLSQVAGIATALGRIGDTRSVAPLVELLTDPDRPALARAFAAVALGGVGDADLLPWNVDFARGLNYAAAPATLLDPLAATGILDIL